MSESCCPTFDARCSHLTLGLECQAERGPSVDLLWRELAQLQSTNVSSVSEPDQRCLPLALVRTRLSTREATASPGQNGVRVLLLQKVKEDEELLLLVSRLEQDERRTLSFYRFNSPETYAKAGQSCINLLYVCFRLEPRRRARRERERVNAIALVGYKTCFCALPRRGEIRASREPLYRAPQRV